MEGWRFHGSKLLFICDAFPDGVGGDQKHWSWTQETCVVCAALPPLSPPRLPNPALNKSVLMTEFQFCQIDDINMFVVMTSFHNCQHWQSQGQYNHKQCLAKDVIFVQIFRLLSVHFPYFHEYSQSWLLKALWTQSTRGLSTYWGQVNN